MSQNDPKKPGVFSEKVINMTLLLIVVFALFALGIMYSNGALAEGRVIQPTDVKKVIAPPAPKEEQVALVPQDDTTIVKVEVEPQPDKQIVTTLTIKRPDVSVPIPFSPGAEVVDLLVNYLSRNGCTVIMEDPTSWSSNTFARFIGSTDCTLIIVEETITEVEVPGEVAAN